MSKAVFRSDDHDNRLFLCCFPMDYNTIKNRDAAVDNEINSLKIQTENCNYFVSRDDQLLIIDCNDDNYMECKNILML